MTRTNMTHKMHSYFLPLFFLFSGLLLSTTGCSPKFYIIDRHTLMEDEAAGEWPEYEKEFLKNAPQSGPTAFQKVEQSAKKKRLYNTLHGEWASIR